MVFIWYTDEDGVEWGLPLGEVLHLRYEKAKEEGQDDELSIITKDKSEYFVYGKSAKKALDEIKIQLKNAASFGWRQVEV